MKLINASGTYGNMTILKKHSTVKALFTDTSCPFFSLGKESPYIFYQFNPFNTDTFSGPSVSVLTGFDLIRFRLTAHLNTHPSPNPTLTLSSHLRQSSTDNILCEYKFCNGFNGEGEEKERVKY